MQVFESLEAVTAAARTVLDEFQAVTQPPEVTRYPVATAVPASAVTNTGPSRWRIAGAILMLGTGAAALRTVAADSTAPAPLPAHRRADGPRTSQ